MTEIAIRTGNDLSIQPDQETWTPKQEAALVQLGIADASQGDRDIFFHQCKRTGLDPFAKQIYMIGRWSREGTKYTIQTAIDGYRLIARRAADRSGHSFGYGETQWCGDDGRWVDVWLSKNHPSAARVVVLRNGLPFPGIAMWDEYVQTTKDGSPNSMWQRMGAGQLAKCAEALALRKAFPQDLSGIYTVDEMQQAENVTVRQIPDKPPTLAAAIASKREESGEAGGYRTERQSQKMFATAREVGVSNEELKPFMASILGREIESSKTLTKAEAAKIIEALEQAKSDGAHPITGEVVEAELEPEDGWPTPAAVPA